MPQTPNFVYTLAPPLFARARTAACPAPALAAGNWELSADYRGFWGTFALVFVLQKSPFSSLISRRKCAAKTGVNQLELPRFSKHKNRGFWGASPAVLVTRLSPFLVLNLLPFSRAENHSSFRSKPAQLSSIIIEKSRRIRSCDRCLPRPSTGGWQLGTVS